MNDKFEALKRAYAERCVDAMDIDTLMDFAFETIMESLGEFTEEQVKTEIHEYYPDLLEVLQND
jgi:hypothetical protein